MVRVKPKKKPPVATTGLPSRPAQPSRPSSPPAPRRTAAAAKPTMTWNPVSQNAWSNAAQRMGALDPPVVQPPNAPPPVTPEGGAQRIGANEDLGLASGTTNSALMQAAQRYGGVGKVLQVGVDADGNPITYEADVTADPNSTLAGIGRKLTFDERDLGDMRERGNTFFSGLHQRGRQELEGQAGRDRDQAGIDFNNFLTNITGGWDKAVVDHAQGLRGADVTDANAAAAIPPEAGPQLPSEMMPTPLSGKATAFAQAQAQGRTKLKNGKWYYQRADGKWIPA